ncbi:synaptic vesicular amine transporter isoform X1 [Parasteatoda tepidariorum]|uniref:synaptic vesicular amine transporter isoform X1 n=1 Tax=Parasteatoda tepidariorum TaxID=114398 RepID=UPI001C7230CD|nr:synaptic vesicular amine transporter isoform X1 [Parasteatoda tepidariorum]XP_042912585.1 synaptic vesicular amine transporter isoform X2 [Parasteatoda tepidariorum]
MGFKQPDEPSCCSCITQFRGSRKLILLIVAIALLLDNMLLTSVVPIIPSFLYHLRHQPTGTITIPEQTISKKIYSIPNIPINDKNVPYFLPRLPLPRKIQKAHVWEPPGFTIVPNDEFWKVTTHSTNNEEELLPTESSQTRHDDLVDENFEVSLMFASKPLIQAFANPFVGPLSNRLGFNVIMFVGFLILISTSLAFAIGNSYTTLFLARSLQGVGSACTSVSGMGMLADIYPDDAERGNAMAIALGGLALGVLIGPIYGGALYQFVGKAAPFLILAGLAVIDGALQLLVLQPRMKRQEEKADEGPSLLTLIKDPYIMLAAGAITFSNIGIAVLEPSLPLWMMDTMDASKWQQGAAFLPASISYLIGTNLFGPLGHRMGRWLAAMIGLVTIGVCLMCVPLAKSVEDLIPANAGIGFAIGMVDSSMMPMLGYLVDLRHTSVYGCVYAIADLAFCLGFIIGPVFSATIVQRFGFEGTVYAVALCSLLYAPLMVLLRNPKGRKELQPVLESSSSKYALQMDDDDETEDDEILKKLKDQPNCY